MARRGILSRPAIGSLGRLVGRAAVMLAVCAGCVLLLGDRLAGIRLSDVLAAMAAIPPGALLLALALGLVSHVAVAGYDLLAIPRLGRYVPWPRALTGGFAGTVMAEVLGFGLVTGSLARARIYRANGIRAAEAVAISGLVSAGFFAGLGLLLALVLLIDPWVAAELTGLAPGTIRLMAASELAVMGLAACLGSLRPRRTRLGRLAIRLPDARWLARAAALAAADLVPAALCLAVMLPAEALPSLAGFVGIYVTGLALGYMLGAPGAAGPFEGMLFLALPAVAPADLAAGILMYRLVYYLPPLVATLVILVRARVAIKVPLLTGAALRDRVGWAMDGAGQAEAELALLGDKHVYFPDRAEGFVSYGISGRIWLVLGDPVGPRHCWEGLIAGLEAEARAAGATLAVYKATAAALPLWRGRGYGLYPLGEEAVIDLDRWTPEGRERREFRRKIKGVAKSGVVLRRHPAGRHPAEAMAGVASAWRAAKGAEQSFSMGHWDPAFNARHMAVGAWRGEEMIGFASFWVSGDGTEWMLDLMRQRGDAPNGTMYAILAEAIAAAREAGARRFNLCMAPLSGLERAEPVTLFSRLAHRLYTGHNARHGLQGMRRFKDVFRPDWTPRHLAVARALDLPEALLAAHRLVQGGGCPQERDTSRTPWLPPVPGAAQAVDAAAEPRDGGAKEGGAKAA